MRMWLLQSHYSQPIDSSEEILEEKRRSYERLMRQYRAISGSTSSSKLSDNLADGLRGRFDAAMRDDLNTSGVVAALFDVAGRAGQEISDRPEAAGEFASLEEAMRETLAILGFDLVEERVEEAEGVRVKHNVTVTATSSVSASTEMLKIPKEVGEKVHLREEARLKKDWATADRLRDELDAEGWLVEDTAGGPILSRR